MLRLKIGDHLLIPFGRPKWSIERIKIVGVSTVGTFFESDTPVVHVERSRKTAIRLREFATVFPEEFPFGLAADEALALMREHLKKTCELDTDSERRFLDLYFSYSSRSVSPSKWQLEHYERKALSPPKNDPLWVFDALLPLPQAHLYLSDPLIESYSFVPENMVKVDFAFWTGREILAVEIDGSSHTGSEAHIRKDRMLQRAGVPVVHILNSGLLKHGEKVIEKLLPERVTEFWKFAESDYRANPFDVPF